MSTRPSNPSDSFFAPQNMTIRQWLTWRRFYGFVVMIAVVATAVSLGLAGRENVAESPSEATLLPVNTIVAQHVPSYSERRSYTGLISAARTSNLAFHRSAELVEVLVDDGDEVAIDQPLARLDNRRLLTQRDQLVAQRSEAASRLEELQNGPRAEVIAAASAEVNDLAAQAELAKRSHVRNQSLSANRAVTKQSFDNTELSLKAADAKHAAARSRLEELVAGTRAEQVKAQAAAVEGLDAMLADIAIEIEDSTLKSPFAGQIAERLVDEGAILSPSTPVLRIVETGVVEARIGLPARVAARLKVGMHQSVRIDGLQFSTSVHALSPEVDLVTRTRLVILRFPAGTSHTVVPGQVARLEMNTAIEADGIWLPLDALSRGTRGLWTVFVATNIEGESAIVERRDVEIVHTDGDRALVRGTIFDGDRVIIAGTHRIVPKQRILLRSADQREITGEPSAATGPNAGAEQ
ncbi:MAG: multidrug efflux pump subunit AcrA (membrane-fusion protein) [Planctomycetaceae bacterium]|jgi:multidrug efflux pump subunit AcrA (membrane-fusion protein)